MLEAGFCQKTLSGKRVFIMPNGVPDHSVIDQVEDLLEKRGFTVGFIQAGCVQEGDQSFIEGHRRDPA